MIYTISAFLGSFLMFMIQPMAGKALLPGFGGSFMVWSIALVFFQAMLLIGYYLTHKLFGNEVSKFKITLFLAFIFVAAFKSGIKPGNLGVGPLNSGFVFGELKLLLVYVALPFLALSTSSLTLQRWWQVDSTKLGDEPFFLYGASNVGAIAGLMSYPFLLEPNYPATKIWYIWNCLFIIWGFLMAVCAPKRPAKEVVLEQEEETEESTPLKWIIPAAAGTAMLSAVTNVITMDIASFPFLWVLPLAIYLISWIKIFRKNPPNLSWWSDHSASLLGFCFLVTLLVQFEFSIDGVFKSVMLLLVLYISCMLAHSSLMARRPYASRRLTSFYLSISIGGVIGTSIIAFLIPLLFHVLAELPIGLFLVGWAISYSPPWRPDPSDEYLIIRLVGIVLITFVGPYIALQYISDLPALLATTTVGCVYYIFSVLKQVESRGRNYSIAVLFISLGLIFADQFAADGIERFSMRNYYGIYKVFDQDSLRFLQMGTTYHGHEMLKGPLKGKPLFYYYKTTPIAHYMASDTMNLKDVAIVGLGAGVMASFGRSGQNFDFYELDPDNVMIANKYFDYLKNSSATIKVFIGDGRLKLKEQKKSKYDLIVLDAFSSDSVPIHLLTKDAIIDYLSVLKKNGILLFHVSNRNLNLAPILFSAAKELKLEDRLAQNLYAEGKYVYPTRWVAMGSDSGIKLHLANNPDWVIPTNLRKVHSWTDDFSSFLDVFPPDISMFEQPKTKRRSAQ